MNTKILIVAIAAMFFIVACGTKQEYKVLSKSVDPTPQWAQISNNTVDMQKDGDVEILCVRIITIADSKNQAENISQNLDQYTRDAIAVVVSKYLKSKLKIAHSSKIDKYIDKLGEKIAEKINLRFAKKTDSYWEEVLRIKDKTKFYRLISVYQISDKIVMEKGFEMWKDINKLLLEDLKEFGAKVEENLKSLIEK